MKITQKEKRILIVWFLFAGFALLVNLGNIEGKVSDSKNLLMTEGQSGIWPFKMFGKYTYPTSTYNTSSSNYRSDGSIGGEALQDLITTGNTPTQPTFTTVERFYGLLNSFGIEEFIGYSLLILCIIFIPKIW